MKKLLFATIVLLAFTLSSCGTANLLGKMKKVEIGMTKRELVSVLGNQYNVQGAVNTPDGILETLRFEDMMSNQPYIFNFLNGELVEWYKKIYSPATVVVDERPYHPPVHVRPEPSPSHPPRNPDGTTSLGGGYNKDSFKVYFRGKIVEDASANSFQNLGGGYGKDSFRVFYRGTLVGDASANSFENLDGGYAKDSFRVFYAGKLLKDASANSFEYLDDGYAKDSFRRFYRGKIQ